MVPSSQGWRSFFERPRLRGKRPLSLIVEDWRWEGTDSLFQACPLELEETGLNFVLCHVSASTA